MKRENKHPETDFVSTDQVHISHIDADEARTRRGGIKGTRITDPAGQGYEQSGPANGTSESRREFQDGSEDWEEEDSIPVISEDEDDTEGRPVYGNSAGSQEFQGLQEDDPEPEKKKKRWIADPAPDGRPLKISRQMSQLTVVFSLLFLGMIGYFVYFQIAQASRVVNSTYNKRQENYEKEVVRGNILSSNGEVLAYTQTEEDGSESRIYPYKNLFAHVVGLSNHGQSGLELANNYDLLTSNSDPVQQIINDFKSEKNIGDNVTTTLDVNLQQACYNALGDYRGAVICIEPSSGRILSMVSKPDYNPNNIDEIWESINSEDSNESMLVNRATQGKYTPGSVFKIFTTLYYIQNNKDYEDFTYECKGSITFDDDYTIKCYYGEAHGWENLENAFAFSCNSAFASVASKFNSSAFAKFNKQMLFNTALPLSIESSKSTLALNGDSDLFELTQTAIGQGKTLATPLHMAMVASGIANDGVLMKPYLVSSIDSTEGKNVKNFSPEEYKKLMPREDAKILQKYMEAVVNYGTATVLYSDYYDCSGKTGTAEIDANNNINSWFVGWVTKNKKQYAVCAVLENIPEGAGVASNVVKNVFDNYFYTIGE